LQRHEDVSSLREVVDRLEQICGFRPLWEILNKHFVDRGHILRCYRIINDARKVLNEIRFTYLPERLKQIGRQNDRLVNELETLYRDLDIDFATLLHHLSEYNKDFEVLQNLEIPDGNFFEADELDELRPLLGLYGLEVEKEIKLSVDSRNWPKSTRLTRKVLTGYGVIAKRTPARKARVGQGCTACCSWWVWRCPTWR